MHHATRALIVASLVLLTPTTTRAAKAHADRRDALKGLALGLVGVGMGSSVAATKVFENVVEPVTNGPSYTRTVLQQHLYLIGEMITTRMLSATFGEGKFGNAGMTREYIEKMLQDPVKLWTNLTIVAPLVEETLFRSFPAAVFGTGW